MYLKSCLALAAVVILANCSSPDRLQSYGEPSPGYTESNDVHTLEPRAPPRIRPSGSIVGLASVIDGDTVDVNGQRVRLFGIDAPEASQTCGAIPCGQQSTDAMRGLIGGRVVACDPGDTDRYGRIVAVCHAGDQDINAWMVASGWAMSYVRYGADYAVLEGEARQSEVGIWRYGASVENPWDYRASKRGAISTGNTAPGKCKIKGNISSKGERIYHSPGQPFYGRTKISEAKGERWFCTAAEARAAGWRASIR